MFFMYARIYGHPAGPLNRGKASFMERLIKSAVIIRPLKTRSTGMQTGRKQPHRPFGRVLGGLPFWGSLLLAWLVMAGSPAAAQHLQRPAASSYDVVALRVEFQPDTTRFTTGNGTFDAPLYDENLAPRVDPLPHDEAYFQAHLDFLSHYIQQVSDGQTRVQTHIVPEVIRVSQQMGAYSPTGFDADSDAERRKLAALVQEAWTLASEISSFDMSGFDTERTAFVLFHAGIGRDVELLGTTLDKTPLDLPSISFTERSLTALGIDNVRFNGFPVSNTLIIPRTETRQAFDFIADEPLLLELSINGLLAASFFNYLGVPDLFNTETGESALGPFGLMDPLGIFAFNGLFPPEPMGWTRFYLGWTSALELDPAASERIVLEAAGLSSDALSAFPSLARASISPAQYFLLENRHRDPEEDGLVMQVWKDGAIVEQRIANSDSSFTRFNIEGFTGGVVVAVDNYDWAVPGGVDEDGNNLNGGLLIWHIDERRLRAGLADNSINADPERRAIDLEEADSAQDIGFPSNNPFAAPVDQGTPFDFFYQGNPATAITATGQEVRLYQNRFGPDTVPDSDTNEGGPSFIVLDDFSAPGPTMSFLFRKEAADGIAPLFSEQINVRDWPFIEGGFIAPLKTRDEVLLYTGESDGNSGVHVFRESEMNIPLEFQGREFLRSVVLPDDRAVFALSLFEADGGAVRIFVREEPDEVRPLITVSGFDFEIHGFGSPLIALPKDGQQVLYVLVRGKQADEVALLEVLEDGTATIESVPTVMGLASDGEQPILTGSTETRVRFGTTGWTYDITDATQLGQPVFGREGGTVGVIPLINENALLFLRRDRSTEQINLSRYTDMLGGEHSMNHFPILIDLDEDGRLDVLTTYGSNLVAFTQNGALVRGFPIPLSAPSVAQPLVAELTDSGAWSIVVASTDGNIYAYDTGHGGRLVEGFPLAVGSRVLATPLLQDQKLYAISEEGSLKGWQLDGLGEIWWGQLYGNAQNQSYVVLAEAAQPVPETSSLIVDTETYNWPNPIRNGETFLRCMTTEDARVEIMIVDAAGALVKEMTMDLRGGTPAEEVWQTNAASGVYFARVKATSDTGETATKLIKMAIIR